MIDTSAAFDAAIVGDARRILLRAVVDLISPDIVYGQVFSSGETSYSRPAELHDKVFEIGVPYVTLEQNRWALDGTWSFAPPADAEQVGFESADLFDQDGSGAIFVEMQFSGVSILQACSVFFPTDDYDGIPVEFTVEVIGDTTYTKHIAGNAEPAALITGFTVNNPTAIRVTVTRWSLPYRRMRIPEIMPGIYETWGNDVLAEFSVIEQSDFAVTTLPYGTCCLSMDNLDRRFEPMSKDGLFQSIEDRQGIEISMGVSGAEYVPVGVYYQYSGGWTTGSNSLTMTWNLVDIIGLLTGRRFIVPGAIPTTLGGWAAAIVAQLGTNFESRYHVHPEYSDIPITTTAENLSNVTCGQLLLWLCQATQTWGRADAETGYLAIDPLWDEGGELTLDNLTAYPVVRANEDVAYFDFTLANGATVTIAGNSPSSPKTVTVKNPFIATAVQAEAAAAWMLNAYGGNIFETTGRGNPAHEIGDVVVVEYAKGKTARGRLKYQSLQIQNGVMQGCQARLVQIGDTA